MCCHVLATPTQRSQRSGWLCMCSTTRYYPHIPPTRGQSNQRSGRYFRPTGCGGVMHYLIALQRILQSTSYWLCGMHYLPTNRGTTDASSCYGWLCYVMYVASCTTYSLHTPLQRNNGVATFLLTSCMMALSAYSSSLPTNIPAPTEA
jgi:hypothetical protein